MKLIDKILHCPDEQGWTNPNISRSENLEKIADEYAIKFARWLAERPAIFNNGSSMEQALSLFKIKENL